MLVRAIFLINSNLNFLKSIGLSNGFTIDGDVLGQRQALDIAKHIWLINKFIDRVEVLNSRKDLINNIFDNLHAEDKAEFDALEKTLNKLSFDEKFSFVIEIIEKAVADTSFYERAVKLQEKIDERRQKAKEEFQKQRQQSIAKFEEEKKEKEIAAQEIYAQGAEKLGLPRLSGTPKQVEWAEKIRLACLNMDLPKIKRNLKTKKGATAQFWIEHFKHVLPKQQTEQATVKTAQQFENEKIRADADRTYQKGAALLGLAPLTGSAKQVEWAERIRKACLADGELKAEISKKLHTKAGRTAAFWIENYKHILQK